MPINWPPAGAPTWPPEELATGWLSASDLKTLVLKLQRMGFTHEAPTPAEQAEFFDGVQCDEGHAVIGRMLISPLGVRYPVAACNSGSHRDILVLWPPYYCGWQSGNYTW